MVKEMDEITIVEVPEMKVLGISKKGNYRMIPELLGKIYEYTVAKKIAIAGPPVFLCRETSAESVKEANEKNTAHVEVAWPVRGAVKGSRTIRLSDLPGGRMVRAVHHGPYETCEPTYHALFTWMGERGLSANGPVREVYLNDPGTVNPDEILTEIYVPVG